MLRRQAELCEATQKFERGFFRDSRIYLQKMHPVRRLDVAFTQDACMRKKNAANRNRNSPIRETDILPPAFFPGAWDEYIIINSALVS